MTFSNSSKSFTSFDYKYNACTSFQNHFLFGVSYITFNLKLLFLNRRLSALSLINTGMSGFRSLIFFLFHRFSFFYIFYYVACLLLGGKGVFCYLERLFFIETKRNCTNYVSIFCTSLAFCFMSIVAVYFDAYITLLQLYS